MRAFCRCFLFLFYFLNRLEFKWKNKTKNMHTFFFRCLFPRNFSRIIILQYTHAKHEMKLSNTLITKSMFKERDLQEKNQIADRIISIIIVVIFTMINKSIFIIIFNNTQSYIGYMVLLLLFVCFYYRGKND